MHHCIFVSYVPLSYVPIHYHLPLLSSLPADYLSSMYTLTVRNYYNRHNHHIHIPSHPILQKNHHNHLNNTPFHFISSNISQLSQSSQLPNCSTALPKALSQLPNSSIAIIKALPQSSQLSQSSQLRNFSIVLPKSLSQPSQPPQKDNFSINLPKLLSQLSQSQAIRRIGCTKSKTCTLAPYTESKNLHETTSYALLSRSFLPCPEPELSAILYNDKIPKPGWTRHNCKVHVWRRRI